MRLALGVVLVAALASLVACGHGDAGELAPGAQEVVTGPSGPQGAAAPASAPTPAQSACAGVAAPTTLSNASDIRDVQIVGSAVFFQSGTTLFRVGKDGKGQVAVFSSPNLIRSYVDQNAILTIESVDDDPAAATLRVIKAAAPTANSTFPDFAAPPADPNTTPAGEVLDPRMDPNAATALVPVDGTTTAAANANPAGIEVFASDDAFFYLLEDGADGDTLLQMSKDAPAPQAVLTVPNVLSHPQLLGTDIWYVQDQQSIFKVTIDDGTPHQVFGIANASCDLAVDKTSAFCSVGSAVERRDLTGGNPTILVDGKTSKTAAPFGALLSRDTTLYVPSSGPDPRVKNVIVALSSTTPGEQKLVACGRSLVSKLSVDATSVAWTEDGGGVFLAPR